MKLFYFIYLFFAMINSWWMYTYMICRTMTDWFRSKRCLYIFNFTYSMQNNWYHGYNYKKLCIINMMSLVHFSILIYWIFFLQIMYTIYIYIVYEFFIYNYYCSMNCIQTHKINYLNELIISELIYIYIVWCLLFFTFQNKSEWWMIMIDYYQSKLYHICT